MSQLRVTVVPVGRTDIAEVEGALARVSKVLGRAVELRQAAPLPPGLEDPERRQYEASRLLRALKASLPRLGVAKLVGVSAPVGSPVAVSNPDATIFVTDVDLFTPSTAGVSSELSASDRSAVISVRRLREAFYRRKADPSKQRSRLVKEILRAVGRLKGLPDCGEPSCSIAPTLSLADIDRKAERFCAQCWRRLSTGAFQV